MSRLSLNAKLWLALAVTWLGLLLLGGWAAWESRSTMLAERQGAVQNVVESAYGIVDDYAKQADAGKLTLEQAKQQAMDRLSEMRYPNSGYMIISTAHPVVIMHPVSSITQEEVAQRVQQIRQQAQQVWLGTQPPLTTKVELQ